MRDYAIITDSGCDLSVNIVEKFKIDVVPMALTISDKIYKHYYDFRELSIEDFYKKIKEGHIGKTSCVNISDVAEAMKEKLQKGLDVLYLSFSSGMSGSYQSAVIAANELQEEYPDANIEVIDTYSGSIGLGMLAYLAAKRKELGENINQVAQYIKDNCKKVCHYFMVDDLKYIQKTGRISTIGSIVGTALGIKPIFKLSNEGKVVLDNKIRGKKSAMKHLIETIKNKCTNKDLFFICHADDEDNANQLAEKIKILNPEAEINIGAVGPIIGNNTGPGSLAVIFFGDKR